MIVGTIINVGAVVVGSSFGLLFRSKLPANIVARVFQSIGLFTLVLGIYTAIKVDNVLVMIFSLVIGSVLGELISLDTKIDKGALFIKRLVNHSHEQFTEGLVTAFLLFCTGSLTILGSIDDGVGNGITLLLSKSILDGFASVALASTLGIGVMCSVIPLFIFQTIISLCAFGFGNFFSPNISLALSSTGGVLLIGLGIKMLNIKNINVVNMLPAILLAPFFVWLISFLK